MPESPVASPESERDLRLARLLDDISRQQRQGRPPDLDALARAYPDLIDELRQLLNVARFAEHFGADGAPPTVSQHPPPAAAGGAAPLPRPFDGYELLEEVGRGGMGVVYKAWEPTLKRYVALKMLLRGESASADDLTRFRAEAQAAAGLSHPGIVPVYQVGERDGRVYFSMKYVAGITLAARVAAGPLPPAEAARLVAAIARAVHHAHEAGILHRDLKPSNVLLDADGRPLVTDFGLAKQVAGGASLTGTGAIVGTPSYMAPEQAEGRAHAVGRAADVWALGAILYELLTGRPPFQAASAVEVLLRVRSEEPVSPRQLSPRIDPDLEFVCLKCLEKRPEHRYPTAAALADDLEAYLKSEPVSARVSSLTYFLSRLLRETHHAPVLENWGALWMWHSLMLFLLCAVTNALYLLGERSHWTYLGLWGVGLVAWGLIFWNWRRRGGPVTFVERQMAHAWAAGVAASIATFVVEVLLDLPVLRLSPMMAVCAGMVFLFKAGTLSGWFYIAAAVTFLAAVPMALLPQVGPLLFGVVSAATFFVPGLKYYRRRRAAMVRESERGASESVRA